MSWAEKRIQQYREGRKPNIFEKIALGYGHPINFLAHLLALAALVYGLWERSYAWIIVAVLLGAVGHLYCRLQK